jgi:hypothetical protein
MTVYCDCEIKMHFSTLLEPNIEIENCVVPQNR